MPDILKLISFYFWEIFTIDSFRPRKPTKKVHNDTIKWKEEQKQ